MKQAKSILLILTLLFAGLVPLRAQQSANAAGGDATGSGGSASYSVGQPVYTYVSGATASSNQGVQQPYEFFTVGIDDNKFINLLINEFPNPAQSVLNLKVENTTLDNLSFMLYDVTGKLLMSQKIAGALTVIPIQKFAAGPYLLSVTDDKKIVKTFNIIKNN